MTTTDIPAPPDQIEQLRELLDIVEGCKSHPKWIDVRMHIERHDSDLGEGGKPLTWVVDEITGDEDTVLARAHNVRSAARVFNGIVSSIELESRRRRLIDSPYLGAAFGRALEVLTAEESAFASDQIRRDLRWALPKAEEAIFAAEEQVPLLAECLEEAERWLDGGWEGVLDEGSFPHRVLRGFFDSGMDARIEAVLHGKRREGLAQALIIFVSVVARNGHDMFDGEITSELERMFDRKVARARQQRQAGSATSSRKGRSAKKAEKSARDRELRANMRGDAPKKK